MGEQMALSQVAIIAIEERAQAIAELVHAKQSDKAGAAYIGHPRRVAANAVRTMRALKAGFTDEQIELVRQACWLHDVLEDSGDNGFPKVLASDLEATGISREVIELVELVTKTEPSSYDFHSDPYYKNIKAHPLARMIKIADITDNHNLDRKEALQALGKSSKNSYYSNALGFLELSDHERMLFEKRINLPVEISDQEWNEALLERDDPEPYYLDKSMEDYYYQFLNSGADEATAARRAREEIDSDSLFLSFRHEGYSVKRTWQKLKERREGQ